MKLGAVILAAGRGARLGGVAKALIHIGNETYLERIARIARLATTTSFVVVIGEPYAKPIGMHARDLGLNVVLNPRPERGMASSVALGFAAIAHHAPDAAWLWPVDHPAVELRTLETLIARLGTHEVAQPRHDGRGGHPPLIASALWPELVACGDLPEGARGVLATADVERVDVDDRGVIRDVDTQRDLQEVH